MTNLKKVAAVLSAVIAGMGATVSAHAAITSTSVSASMQILRQNQPDVSMTKTGATAASVDLTAPDTPLHVQSSMSFSSLTAESAVFSFLIGMHGNGFAGQAYLGALGPSDSNGGMLHYNAAAAMTATATYDYEISPAGRDVNGNVVTFGMNSILINSPSNNYSLAGTGTWPTAGHYQSTTTLNLLAGDNYFGVHFGPNVNGPIGWIDGQYKGTVTYTFATVAAPVPEPETYAMLLAGLGLLGVVARCRKQKAA